MELPVACVHVCVCVCARMLKQQRNEVASLYVSVQLDPGSPVCDDFISTAVGVVDNCIERLIGQLPE